MGSNPTQGTPEDEPSTRRLIFKYGLLTIAILLVPIVFAITRNYGALAATTLMLIAAAVYVRPRTMP